MVEIESQKDDKTQHYDRRQNPEIRMEDCQINDEEFYDNDHERHYQMHKPLMLNYRYLFSVKLNDFFSNKAAVYGSGYFLFMIPAIFFYINSEFIVHFPSPAIHTAIRDS